MNYWDDMQSKFGFGDGEAVPEGAECYREVYISVVNALAEKLGSGVRAVPWDRPGCHNWCLILFAKAGKLDTPEAAVDKEMGEAIEIARCGDLDGWVNCTVQVNHEFAGLVREIAGECEKQHAA
jgi:hypothetical protein